MRSLQGDTSVEVSMDTELDASLIGDQPSVGVEEEAESMEQSDDEDVEQLSDGEEDEDEDAIRGRHKLNSWLPSPASG